MSPAKMMVVKSWIVLIPTLLFGQRTDIQQLLQNVSSQNISSHIASLQSPSGQQSRIVYTAGFDSAVAYVYRQFASVAGLSSVELDTFFIPSATPPWNSKPIFSVVATLKGTQTPQVQVIVGAHLDCSASLGDSSTWRNGWQTVRAPGADDNASGVAAVLEIARVTASATWKPAMTVKLIAFGAEELGPAYNLTYSILGSQAYVAHARARGDSIAAMVNMDMIAYNPNSLFCDIEADSISQWLGSVAAQANTIYQIGLGTSSPPFNAGAGSDHFRFWQAHIPAILLIERYLPYPFNPYYHRSTDSLAHLNMDLATRITQLALATVATIASPQQATSVQQASAVASQEAELSAYPNPFNPTTNFQLLIANLQFVKLSVFDLLGREVATLVNEEKPPGTYAVRWDATEFPSGIYFCRLTTGGSIETRKLALLK